MRPVPVSEKRPSLLPPIVTRNLGQLLLVVLAMLFLFPMIWMVATSLKSPEEIQGSPMALLSGSLFWDNYRRAFEFVPLATFFKNSLFLVVICTAANVASATLAAFGFARLKAPGRDWLFLLFLSTMMLPPQVTMIPVFLLFQKLGLINTYYPLIIPALLTGGAFNVFLLRQFFLSLPRDLEEAALIDGCSFFGVFWSIVLPLSKPAIITVGIFSLMFHWNDFLNPLIYLHDQDLYTLALGLNLFKGTYIANTPWGPLMAASTLTVLPIIVLFFALQRYFVEGITLSGLKA
jgi:multiple sugar transport system permease protein